jgi:hypothetical protein
MHNDHLLCTVRTMIICLLRSSARYSGGTVRRSLDMNNGDAFGCAMCLEGQKVVNGRRKWVEVEGRGN